MGLGLGDRKYPLVSIKVIEVYVCVCVCAGSQTHSDAVPGLSVSAERSHHDSRSRQNRNPARHGDSHRENAIWCGGPAGGGTQTHANR